MEWLDAPFTAGSLTSARFGPSHHPQRLYEKVKIAVVLRTTTGRWRTTTQHPRRKFPVRSTYVCLGDVGMSLGEAAFQGGFSSQSHFTRCFRAAQEVFRLLGERHRHRRKRFGLRVNLIAALANLQSCKRSNPPAVGRRGRRPVRRRFPGGGAPLPGG